LFKAAAERFQHSHRNGVSAVESMDVDRESGSLEELRQIFTGAVRQDIVVRSV
jgi:hypothetical protein